MNEVEKMYENVGLSNMWVERYNDGYYEHERYYNSYKEMINNMMKANDWTLTEAQEVAKRECKKEHPPFTAEKQLRLIEFMLKKYGEETIGFELWKDNSYHAMCYLGYDGFENYADSNTLGGAIAGLIILYWKDFTKVEQNEIKEILE